METSKSEAKRICIDLYEEDYKNLQHMKVHYDIEIHDLIHMIVSEIFKNVDLTGKSGKEKAPITVTYDFNVQTKTAPHIKPYESGYPGDATHDISKYDYTYYHDEKQRPDDSADEDAMTESGKKKGDKKSDASTESVDSKKESKNPKK